MKELLKLVNMDQTKDFAEVLKAVALEYDLGLGVPPESDYEGYNVLSFFVRTYIKEPLGFNHEEWTDELLRIKGMRQREKEAIK